MKKFLFSIIIIVSCTFFEIVAQTNVLPQSGNVGIGTTSPQTKLDVRGSILSANPDYSNGISGSVLQIQQGTTTGNTYSEIGAYINGGASWGNLILNRGGNVGIGTTSPTQKLEIGGGRPMTFNSSLGAIKMKGDTGGWAMNYGFLGSSGKDLGGFWGYGGADEIGQWSIGKDYTDNFFVVKNTGNVGIGTTNPIARLEVAGGTVKFSENWFPYVDGNNYHRAGNHIFADNAANEKMRITGFGNVGIGTANPTEKLSVYGINNSAPGIMSFESSREDVQNAEVGILKAKNSGVEIAKIGLNRAGGSYSGFLNFWVKKTNETTMYEAMRISENGDVGIGTAAPESKLHIKGDVNPRLTIEATNTSNIILKDPATTAQINTYNDGTLRLTSAINSASTQLVLGKDGGVGIGTSTPKNSLEIVATNKSGLTLTGLSQIVTQGGIVPQSRTLGINFLGEVVVLNGSNGIQPDFTENIKFINDISSDKTAKLISGNANGGAIRFGANATKAENRDLDLGQIDNNSVFYSRLTVKTETGHIGIGTTAPSEKMTLESGNLQIQKGNGGAGSFGKIQWQNSLAYSNSARAFIEARRGGNDDGNLDFATANTTGEAAVVRMTINNSGNVGININTPTAMMDINGPSRLRGLLEMPTNTDFIWNAYYSNSTWKYRTNGFAGGFYQDGLGGLAFNVAPSGQTDGTLVFKRAYTVLNNGNFGIGTSSPTQKLHVGGNSMLSGANPTQMYDWSGVSAFSTGIFGNTTNNTRFSIYTNSAGEAFSVNYLNGSVGVGTTTVPANYKFAVAGDMIAERVVVKLTGNWPDYVFSPTYKRSTLSEVEEFINKNHHLPNIPSAKEVADNGIDVGKMNAKLLEKMEEMTLYMIEQQKEIKALREEVEQIKDKK